MYYLLFTLYFLVLCFLINRIPFIKNAELEKRLVVILFLLKISAGLLIGWMSATYYPQGNDYWNLNRHAWEEYQVLINDPKDFFTNIFYSHYPDKYGGFFNSFDSYWKDLANNIIIKALAICNILSRGNYYINSLFCNFFGFFGHVALYRVFIHVYKQKKWPVIAGCFILPSTLYFTSGIHKDSMIFTMLGLFCYAFYFSTRQRFTTKRILLLVLSVISILLIRNYVLVALVPAAIAMYIADRNERPLKTFAFIYTALLCLIILVTLIFPSSSPLKIITQKQKDFLDLPVATSQIATDTLQPTLSSFATNAPKAMEHGLLRPYVWEFPGTFLMLLAIELLIYQLLFLYMLTRPKVFPQTYRPFIYFGIFLSLTLLLFAGYIVPNAGSLVRYRSLYLPFLVTPILCSIWQRSKAKKAY